MTSCVNCSAPAVQLHHVVYAQELRRFTGYERGALVRDERNLVPVCQRCHERHHNRFRPLPLWVLPDSVFEFGAEVMGNGPAYEYLLRRYMNPDPRLGALLLEDVV